MNVTRAVVVLFALGLAPGAFGGCVPVGAECAVDGDCGGGECTHNGECAAAGTLVSAHVTWTMFGEPPSDESCAPVDHLTVHFMDADGGGDLVYEPVVCTLGEINYNRLPPRLDEVRLIARDVIDLRVASAVAPLAAQDNEIALDLQP